MHVIARCFITFVALVLTLLGSNVADWNHTHILSSIWSPHARFHGAWFVLATSLLSLLSVWLVWSRNNQPDRTRIAAYVQGSIWLAFFPAMVVPHTLLADPGREVELAGIDLNLLGAILVVILLVTALALLWKERSPSRG